jgi:hypothetical protein
MRNCAALDRQLFSGAENTPSPMSEPIIAHSCRLPRDGRYGIASFNLVLQFIVILLFDWGQSLTELYVVPKAHHASMCFPSHQAKQDLI